MTDPRPPYLADALARFRSAADAAVDQGRRVAGDAAAAGAAFQRESDEQVRRLRRGEGPEQGARERDLRPTPPDLQAASAAYRAERGLPVPDLPDAEELLGPDELPEPEPPRQRRPAPPPDDDFSNFRIMGPA